jgi:hypothetical protein
MLDIHRLTPPRLYKNCKNYERVPSKHRLRCAPVIAPGVSPASCAQMIVSRSCWHCREHTHRIISVLVSPRSPWVGQGLEQAITQGVNRGIAHLRFYGRDEQLRLGGTPRRYTPGGMLRRDRERVMVFGQRCKLASRMACSDGPDRDFAQPFGFGASLRAWAIHSP